MEGAVRALEEGLQNSLKLAAEGVTEKDFQDVFEKTVFEHGGTSVFSSIYFGAESIYNQVQPSADKKLTVNSLIRYDIGCIYKGYFAENFVAQEFICSGVKELYCWREKTAEVEFLREINGDVLPIEIKSGWVTQSKSLKVFSQKYNPKYRTIISANNIFFDKVNNIHRYPLYLASSFPLPGPNIS